MCLAKAYLSRNGERELLMREIAYLGVGDEKLLLRTLFGEQKEVEAKLREIDFANSSIILEKLGDK
jgi:predicted RNA-binding protein